MKPTWIIHFIPCDQSSYHTHGPDAYGSLELELNLPLPPHRAGLFINLVANEIAEKGKRYRSGDREDNVFNLPFYLFETAPIRPSRDKDRVLRILFCDPAGKYPWEPGCTVPYSSQLDLEEKQAIIALLQGQKEGTTNVGAH